MVLLVVFFSFQELCAQPCDYEIREGGDLMSYQREATKAQTVWSDDDEALVFVLSKSEENKALEVIHMKRISEMMCVDEGSSIQLILENGEEVILENLTGPACADGKYSSLHQAMEHFLGAGFRIEENEIKTLLSSPVKSFAILFEEEEKLEFNLPDKISFHENGFDWFGEDDFQTHVFFIQKLPCLEE